MELKQAYKVMTSHRAGRFSGQGGREISGRGGGRERGRTRREDDVYVSDFVHYQKQETRF